MTYTYSCISDLILVFRSIYLPYISYTYITEHKLVLLILYLYYGYRSTHRYYKNFTCTKVPVGSIQIHYTEVPEGTTGLILILQNLYLYYRYRSSSQIHYKEVPVGTTGLILILQNLYLYYRYRSS